MITDAGGSIQGESDFYPYGGEMVVQADSTANHYKFTGKERDTESNLDYFGARYYANGLGRFLTPDWSATPVPVPYAQLSNPQTLNLYSYVENNPITGMDPDGHLGMEQKRLNSAPANGPLFGASGAMEEAIYGETTDPDTLLTDSMVAAANPDPPQQAQNNNPINMSVSVSQEPQIMENLKLGDKTMTGVGAQLNISLSDKSGNALSGSVTESNKEGGMQNPGSVTLTNGAFKDYVGKFGDASKMPGTVADLKDYVTTNPITVTSTQTLNISAGKASYQATWTRTLSNVDANGKLNTTFNSHGMNFTIKWTDPVIKAISP